jgi:Domain of unknown function (DUF222)
VYSKINLGELMERQPGEGSGAGEEEPVPGPGLPGDHAIPDPGAPGGATPDPGLPGDAIPDPGAPGDTTHDPGAPGGAAPDPGLAGFAKGGVWDSAVPSAALAAALEGAAGEGWRCEGGSRDDLIGAVRSAAALESWACAAKLGVLRSLIREDGAPLPGESCHGDLPDAWSRSLTHDVALALAMSPVSAENLLQTAWDLGALLPGIGALLEDGTLTYPKARAVNDALELLSEQGKAAAEAMIAPRLGGKTFGQVDKLAAAAAIAVDPDLAERTREHAERNRARVMLKRERSGAATLSGCDLPPAETLAAHAAACARAQVYKDSGVFPGVLMDQFRAMAYLDLMNQISAQARIAAGPPEVGLGAPGESAFRDEPEPDDPGAPSPPGSGGSDCPCQECDGRCASPDDAGGPDDDEPDSCNDDDEPEADDPDDDGLDDDGPDDDGPHGDGSDDGRRGDVGPEAPSGLGRDDGLGQDDDDARDPGTGPPGQRPPAAPPPPPPPPSPPTQQPPPSQPGPSSPWSASPSSPAPPKPTDLIIPLATLLGPPRRPGESHGFGPLDPALSRALAALAAASPHTTACVTVTDRDGYAIGHGCLTTGRRRAPLPGAPEPPLTALPARLNLTITATRLAKLLPDASPPGPARSPTGWALTPPGAPRPAPDQQDQPGDPPWRGTWTITLPSGLQYAVPLEPVPTHDCDHRRESKAYEPNDMLRHLVQIRDHECTFPTCSRHARESDFEHATPYDQGGRTCACNAGARSRRCHQVKQSPGWKVTQPKPGWHQWETPSGRTYTQEPKRYPA